MSAEKLYREVRSGRVKLDQLNDAGKAALKGYMDEKDKRDRDALVGGAKKVKSAVQKVGSNVASKVKTAQEASRANRPQPMLTARSPKNYSLDDVILAGQGDRAAEVRLKGTAWETMTPEQRAALKPEIDSRARELTQKRRDEDWGRNAPVLGEVIRGLDWLADKTKPAADVALDLYTPGGGLAAVNTMTKGAAHGVAKMFPGLANSAGGRVASTALTEAAVGAPLGVSNALARDMEATPREIAENALYGAGGGALFGGAGRGVGELAQWGRNQAREGLEGILRAENAIERAASAPQYSKLKLPKKDENVSRIMSEIRDEVNERMTPPMESEKALRAWVRPYLGDVSNNELRALTYDDLRSMSEEIRRGLKPYDVAVDVARRRGYDLEAAFQRDPSIRDIAKRDASRRAYGIFPENLPSVSRPIFRQGAATPDPVLSSAAASVPDTPAELADQALQSLAREFEQAEAAIRALDERFASGGSPSADETRQLMELMDRRNQALGKIDEVLQNPRFAQVLPEGVQGRVAPGVQAMAAEAAPTSAVDNAANGSQPVQARDVIPPDTVITEPTTKKTIGLVGLAKSFQKNLGVTIGTGRTGFDDSVLGIYKVGPEVIRSNKFGEYGTYAHESGHHFAKKYGLQESQFEKELLDMMDQVKEHDYRQYPRDQWLDEGIAEYARILLTEPQKAKALAPRFSAFFEQKVPRKIQRGIIRVQKDVRTWIDQGSYNQAKGMIDREGATEGKRATLSKLYTRFIDDLHPIELLEKSLKGKLGVGSQSMYKLARLSRGVGEQAKMAITRGIFDSQGNKLSEGLRTIVEPLEKIGMKPDDLDTYLSVVHALDLKRLNKKVPFSDDRIAAVMQKWGENQTVQKVQKQIVQFNNALMDLLVEAQIYDSKQVAAMRKKYPNYVPFMRFFDEDAVAGFRNGGYGSSKGFANLTNPVKRMSEEGSERVLVNPLESMVKNAFLTMNAASQNKVGLQLVELAKIDGAGAWVEHVPGGKSGRDRIIDVSVNGEKQAYKIRDPELYNALLSLDRESASGIVRFLGGAAGLLRAGATLTPEFMIRNAFRDVASAIVNSTKYGFNPIDFFRGFFHTVTKSDVFEKFINSGGAVSTMMSLDRDMSREALDAVFTRSLKDKTLNVITSRKEFVKFLKKITIDALRKGGEVSELSTKVGKAKKVFDQTGDWVEAAFEARDLMDFNRAGSYTRQWNRMAAFLNASMQGTDKLMRSFKQNPARFLTRAFTTLVLPATMLYYWNRSMLSEKEKAQYDNIPQWQKDSFFVMGIPGTGEFVRIPKPFEAGMLFSTSTERMLRWIEDNDPEAFKGYGRATAESMTPPMMLTALSPILEAMTNYSFFRNAPVVPQGEQRREKKDQYGIFTSELSKEVAQFLDGIGLGNTNAASPRIIDNTLKGYFAGLGQYGIDLIDMAIDASKGGKEVPRPEKKWTEDPFFRSFFVSTSGGGQIREDFYRRWEKIDSARASANFNETSLPIDVEKEYERMRPHKREIDKLSKEYKEVQRSKTLTPKQKRSQLDELDVKMNEAARKALGK